MDLQHLPCQGSIFHHQLHLDTPIPNPITDATLISWNTLGEDDHDHSLGYYAPRLLLSHITNACQNHVSHGDHYQAMNLKYQTCIVKFLIVITSLKHCITMLLLIKSRCIKDIAFKQVQEHTILKTIHTSIINSNHFIKHLPNCINIKSKQLTK